MIGLHKKKILSAICFIDPKYFVLITITTIC